MYMYVSLAREWFNLIIQSGFGLMFVQPTVTPMYRTWERCPLVVYGHFKHHQHQPKSPFLPKTNTTEGPALSVKSPSFVLVPAVQYLLCILCMLKRPF